MGQGENQGEAEMLMSEAEEEAFAAELLGVSSEAELDHFLGGLFKNIVGKLGGVASQFLGKAGGPLTGALKGIVGKALPFIGGALGTAIPIPGVGTALGSALGTAASSLLQGEMENLEAEEQEFETARRFVRLATQAIRHGTRRPFLSNPTAAASLALRQTMQRWRHRGGYGRWGRNAGWRRPGYYGGWPGAGAYGGWPGAAANVGDPGSGAYGDGYGGTGGDAGAAYAGQTSGAPGDTGQWPSGSQCPPCPPPPACPVCGDATGGATSPGGVNVSPAPATPPPTPSGGSEMEFGYTGEAEGEGEYYETNDPSYVPSGDGGRSGRWVRRGRKIVLYGA